MKKFLLALSIVGLLAACVAPPVAQPPSQPAAQQTLPEVTVFRSPT